MKGSGKARRTAREAADEYTTPIYEESALPDCSIPQSLTRVQEQKYKHLLERGGKCAEVALYVGMPDGRLAVIDPFGRVTWN